MYKIVSQKKETFPLLISGFAAMCIPVKVVTYYFFNLPFPDFFY